MTAAESGSVVHLRPMFGTGLAVAIVLLAIDAVLAGRTVLSPDVRAGWAATPLAGLIVLTVIALVLHVLALAALSERLDRGADFTEHSTLWRPPVHIDDAQLRAIRQTSWFIRFDGGPQRRFVTGCGIGMPAKRLLGAYLPLVQQRPSLISDDSLVRIYLALGMPPSAFGRQP